ncbi:MAG: hypothetical protein QOJ35_2973 [Solirubrobacteraceae bacterium]|jgi:hypothetical protein|nr:hypothetical protein [Solirubrobacteraceae bacterium]
MTARPAAVALLAVLSVATPAAIADVGAPDDSIQTAFGPLRSGTWYAGTFKSAVDVDYLAIAVPQAPAAVHVDVANTIAECMSPDLTGCPIWATLIDAGAMQVGGEGSSAGTGPVTAGGSDAIDWTFAQPGTYYLAMDSAGDLPTYAVRQVTISPPPSGGLPAGGGNTSGQSGSGGADRSAPASLVVSRRQRGDAVRCRIVVRRALRRLTLSVRRGDGTTFQSLRLGAVGAGRRVVALRLAPAGRRALARHGRLPLTVHMIAVPQAGSRLIVGRPVTLVNRPAR